MPEIILACISGSLDDDIVLSAARQKADALGVGWHSIFIDVPSRSRDQETRRPVLATETKAGILGAQQIQRMAPDILTGIQTHLSEFGPDDRLHLFVGKRDGRPWWKGAGLAARLERLNLPRCEIHPVSLGASRRFSFRRFGPMFGGETLKEIAYTAGYIALATLLIYFLQQLGPYPLFSEIGNVSLVYLIACMLAALFHGMLPGIIAALLSFMAINFYFVAPGASPLLSSDHLVHLILFLVAAMLVSLIGSGTRYSLLGIRQRERQLHTLLSLGRTLNLSLTQEEALKHLHYELGQLLHRDVAYFLPAASDATQVSLRYPADTVLDAKSEAALHACWFDYIPTGAGTDRIHHAEWRFQPLLSNRGFNGAIGVHIIGPGRDDASLALMLEGLADLSATILERIDITHSVEQTRMREEREKLRTMLMSSVSHDLKTPLASIIGSLNAYHMMQSSLSPERLQMLTDTALEEAVRLDHFITNILDLAKLEGSGIQFKKEWSDPVILIHHAARRLGHRLAKHRLEVIPPPKPIEVEIDPALTGLVLYHLLDNAAKYAPGGTVIRCTAALLKDGWLEVRVQDEGPGIEENMHQAVFNKYTRLKNTDTQVAGTGLGLAICKIIAEGQNGQLHVENKPYPEKGAVFVLRLPFAREHPELPASDTL